MRTAERSHPTRSHLSHGLMVLALCMLAAPAGAAEVLPFAELEVGMTGVGKTVFSGTRIEEFKVEIVGLMPNVMPRRNLILVRCSGNLLGAAGIAQGMSGSPIYIRGKLIGALAYSWGFAAEAIAGVTPIEEMLAIDRQEEPSAARAGAARVPSSDRLLLQPAEIDAFFRELLGASPLAPASYTGSFRPMALPLHAAGFEPGVLARLGASLGANLIPTGGRAADGNGNGKEGPATLQPGSAVGVQLMRGDLDLTAIGTVTDVEDGRVLAFGHPFLGIGPTAMPMTSAHVHLILPSLQSSFKMASPGAEVGTIRQDRSTGILGELGPSPHMIPVRLEISTPGDISQTFRFDLVDDPLLTPLLLNYSMLNILSSAEKSFGPMTLRLREGSSIQIKDDVPVELDNFYSGDFAAPFAAGLSAYILYVIMNNEFEVAEIEGVNLLVEFVDERRSARLENVWADRNRVRAGETVTLHLTLRPFREDPVSLELLVPIPPETPAGRLLVRVGDGLTLARLQTPGESSGVRPRDFDQLVFLINQIRSFNRVYAYVSIVQDPRDQGGTTLPGLPPSVGQVMLMPQGGSSLGQLRSRGLLEESVETEYAVSGYRRIYLEVVP